jgi:hypothetical protein
MRTVALLLIWFVPATASAQAVVKTTEEAPPPEHTTNIATSPLTAMIAVNLQDYYIPELSELSDEESNQLYFRGVVPHALLGPPQLLRASIPILTVPEMDGTGEHTDVGDLSVFDLFFIEVPGVQLGVGPLLVVPIAGSRMTGSGKWQAGGAAAAIVSRPWGVIGGLVTYQRSFASASEVDRPEVSLGTFQPFVTYNLPIGFYLRTSGIWAIDFRHEADVIPIGLGGGKVFDLDQVILNAFIEPQVSVWTDGMGMPEWQLLLGLNTQFPR